MINKGKDPVTGEALSTKDIFLDEQTDEKIRRHLTDINDVITEEDIKNVRTDFNRQTSNETANAELNEETTDGADQVVGKEKVPDDEDDQPIITPWNVLHP